VTRAPSMAATMFLGMILFALGFWMYSIAAVLSRARSIMLERERRTDWVTSEVRRAAA